MSIWLVPGISIWLVFVTNSELFAMVFSTLGSQVSR